VLAIGSVFLGTVGMGILALGCLTCVQLTCAEKDLGMASLLLQSLRGAGAQQRLLFTGWLSLFAHDRLGWV